jgi:hypothetical protein
LPFNKPDYLLSLQTVRDFVCFEQKSSFFYGYSLTFIGKYLSGSYGWSEMMQSETKKGLEFHSLGVEDFREFARRHGTSEEIGPIATYLDPSKPGKDGEAPSATSTVTLRGLMGCEVPCAAICCLITPATDGKSAAIKLDSIIVDKQLRRQGLGAALVARSFLDIIDNHQPEIRNIYAHSVHPATVRMLRSFGFKDPLPTGAPISAMNLEEKGDEFRTLCNDRIATVTNTLRLNCSYCRSNHRKTRHWCAAAR